MRKILFRFFTVIIVVLVALICLEILFRAFRHDDVAPLFSVTQHTQNTLFEPNTVIKNGSAVAGEFETISRINNFGYRGMDFSLKKDPDVIRILAIGDSFTFGVGANDSETIPAVLEARLKELGYQAEVINAGIGHQSPIRHFYNLKQIHLQYRPDLVILLYDLTDLWDDWYWEKHAVFDNSGEIAGFDLTYEKGKRSWWLTLAKHSALCFYVHNKVIRSFNKWQVLGTKAYFMVKKDGGRAKAEIISAPSGVYPDNAVMQYDGLLFLRGRAKKGLIDQNWPRSEKYLLRIKELLDAHGIPLVISMYPHGIHVSKNQWKEGRVPWGFEQDKIYDDYYAFDLMKEFCQKHQIPFVNTLFGFLEKPDVKYFYDWDGHMTPAGYQCAAAEIAQNLSFQKELSAVLYFKLHEKTNP